MSAALASIGEEIAQAAVAKATDYFSDIARRRVPMEPEPFAAEMLARTLGSLVGISMPDPLPNLGNLSPMRRQRGELTVPRPQLDVQKLIPQAEAMLAARGFRGKPGPVMAALFAAMLAGDPETEWTRGQWAAAAGVPAEATSHAMTQLKKFKIITKARGADRGKDVRWCLAALPRVS